MTSYGGNAGKRSFHPGDAPAFPRMTRDGIFFLDSCVRLTDVKDGTSNTFLFGERFHHDPEHDRRNPIFFPGNGPLAGFGKWGTFLEFDSATYEQMLRLNIHSLVELCRLYAPGMVSRRSGGIINVASTAAFLPVAFAAPRPARRGRL